MITVAVVAILIAIAVPSFTSVINTNRLAATANELVASLQTARMEAIRRNTQTVVCRTTDGTSCAGNGAWSQWITFVDANADRAPQATEILRQSDARAPVAVSTSAAIQAGRIVFRADGLARATSGTGVPTAAVLQATFGVCIPTTRPTENRRRVSIAAGGRVSTVADTSATCVTPSN